MEEALDLSFDRLLMMMMISLHDIYRTKQNSAIFFFPLNNSANFEVKGTDNQSQGINITDQMTSLLWGVA